MTGVKVGLLWRQIHIFAHNFHNFKSGQKHIDCYIDLTLDWWTCLDGPLFRQLLLHSVMFSHVGWVSWLKAEIIPANPREPHTEYSLAAWKFTLFFFFLWLLLSGITGNISLKNQGHIFSPWWSGHPEFLWNTSVNSCFFTPGLPNCTASSLLMFCDFTLWKKI